MSVIFTGKSTTDKLSVKFSSVNPNIVKDGLVLYVDAANSVSYPRSGITWTDLSQNIYTGSLFNSPAFNTNNAGTINFDGIDDYVLFNNVSASGICDPILYGEKITFSGWARINNIAATQYILTSGAHTGRSGIALTTTVIAIKSSVNSWVISKNLFPSSNIWHNFCITLDGTTMRAYINGIFDSSTASTTVNITPVNTLTIGTVNTSIGTFLLAGNLSNISIYNKFLSANEVLQNFNALRGRFGV